MVGVAVVARRVPRQSLPRQTRLNVKRRRRRRLLDPRHALRRVSGRDLRNGWRATHENAEH